MTNNPDRTRNSISVDQLDFFEVPRELLAREPREVRGEKRDSARLLIINRHLNQIIHSKVREIGDYFHEGDIFVLNDSAVVPSVMNGRRTDGGQVNVYLCSNRGNNIWHAYIESGRDIATGDHVFVQLSEDRRLDVKLIGLHEDVPNLRTVELFYKGDLIDFLNKTAQPVRSTYTAQKWGLEYYQNLHARNPGSVETPSAGRHFTPELIADLENRGIEVLYLTLHTGMSNLIIQEQDVAAHSMYDEYFSISQEAADRINAVRSSNGGRVVVIGTTMMRALETVANDNGQIKAYSGWTNLFISPGHRFKVADAFLTNFHGPRTTRLAMAMAFSGIEMIKKAYREAIAERYLFYEFGDTTLTI